MPALRTHPALPVLALVAVLALLGGCAGGAQPAAGEGAAPASSPAGGSQDGAATVTIKSLAFDPPRPEVAAGTEVTWTNEDAQVTHTVTAGTPGKRAVPGSGKDDEPAAASGAFDGQVADAGDTFSHKFDEPGTAAYFCRVHPTMTGEVLVD